METTPVNNPAEPGVQRQTGFRCVLLARGGRAGAPPDLLLSLSRREVEVVACSTPFEAMARLMSLRSADGDRPTALLVVEPETIYRAVELVRAAERFAPRVARWRYDETGDPKLRGFSFPKPAPAERHEPAGNGITIAVRPPAPPRLRLTGALGDDAGSAGSPSCPDSHGSTAEFDADAGLDANLRAADLLTEEEIAMLLADDEAPSRRGGGRRTGAGGSEGGP